MRTEDNILRLKRPIYQRTIDYGGMFEGKAYIVEDHAKDCDLPYLAVVVDGWNGGRGKRHSTYDEAFKDLERLTDTMFFE